MTKRTAKHAAPDPRFASMLDALLREPAVTQSRMFGSAGLKVGGKVFVMLVKGKLVAKLPKERVDELVSSGAGEYFDPGPGKLMKEWVALGPKSEARWLQFAREAKHFVATL